MKGRSSEEYIKLKRLPHLGISLYGRDRRPILGKNFFELGKSVDNCIETRKFNSLVFAPWEKRLGKYSDLLMRTKRGKSWDKELQALLEREASFIGFDCIPNAKLRAFNQSALCLAVDISRDQALSNLYFFGISDINPPLLNVDCRNLFYLVLEKSIEFTNFDWGYIQSYPWSPEEVVTSDFRRCTSKLENLPLMSKIAHDRYYGDFRRLAAPDWAGEPFNLYWGNLIRKDLADKVGLEQYLVKKIGLKSVQIRNSIPSESCVGTLLQKYLWFCLSDDITESLSPSPDYVNRYEQILNFLLENGMIHPGLD